MTAPFQHLLDQFAGIVGLPTLHADANGVCALLVDDAQALNIALDAQREDVVLFAPLGPVAGAARAECFARMLRANGAGGSRVMLGLAADSDTALLSGRRPLARLDAGVLAQWAGEFLGLARAWRTQLAAAAPAVADAPASAPSAAHWMRG